MNSSKKQPRIGGDVSKEKGAKPEALVTDKLTVSVTTKFSLAESARLKARARSAGVPLRSYIRRELTPHDEVSRDTALLLVGQAWTRELLARLWAASGEEPLDIRAVQQIVAQVDAIDPRVLLAKALGKKL